MNNTINLNGMSSYNNSLIQSVMTKKTSRNVISGSTNADFGDNDTFVSKLKSKTEISGTAEEQGLQKTDISFKDMWTSKYPGAKYHVMDASKISQGVWQRNDFPFEKFFEDTVDESVLKWQPSGKEPAMADGSVQSRLDSTLGKKSILVPPELEEKMKSDPKLAQKVMDKVDGFIANHPTRPGRVCSYLIALDENGDIAHFNVTGGGGNISGPTKEEQRRFEEEQEAKKKKLSEKRALEKKWEKEAIEKRQAYRDFLNGQVLSKTGSFTEFDDIASTTVGTRMSEIFSAYEVGTIGGGGLF